MEGNVYQIFIILNQGLMLTIKHMLLFTLIYHIYITLIDVICFKWFFLSANKKNENHLKYVTSAVIK
jgi:hypothetical protein